MKKSQYTKGKRLTKQERIDILKAIIKLGLIKVKEEVTWKPLTREPQSIKEIFNGT